MSVTYALRVKKKNNKLKHLSLLDRHVFRPSKELDERLVKRTKMRLTRVAGGMSPLPLAPELPARDLKRL